MNHKCRKCSADLSIGAAFCGQCGHDTRAVAPRIVETRESRINDVIKDFRGASHRNAHAYASEDYMSLYAGRSAGTGYIHLCRHRHIENQPLFKDGWDDIQMSVSSPLALKVAILLAQAYVRKTGKSACIFKNFFSPSARSSVSPLNQARCSNCSSFTDGQEKFCSRCGQIKAIGEPKIIETSEARKDELFALVKRHVNFRAKRGSESDLSFYYESFIFRKFHWLFRVIADFPDGKWGDIKIQVENQAQLKSALILAQAYIRETGQAADIYKKY